MTRCCVSVELLLLLLLYGRRVCDWTGAGELVSRYGYTRVAAAIDTQHRDQRPPGFLGVPLFFALDTSVNSGQG